MTIKHNCQNELKTADLKVTRGRLGVLAAIEQAAIPIDVVSIIAFLKKNKVKADQATVFRILNSFVNKGIVKQIQFLESKLRYEIATTGDHHHLICNSCGKITDVSDCGIKYIENKIEKKKKFLVKSHSLEFFGLCQDCQK